MVKDLILALKTDNVDTCFILSGISFYSLGAKLSIVSISEGAVGIFLLTKLYKSLLQTGFKDHCNQVL